TRYGLGKLGCSWDCEEQLRHGLIEARAQEMGLAYYIERRADEGAGAEAQRGLDMLNRDVGLARPSPEDADDKPASSVVRVERQGAVNATRDTRSARLMLSIVREVRRSTPNGTRKDPHPEPCPRAPGPLRSGIAACPDGFSLSAKLGMSTEQSSKILNKGPSDAARHY